MSEKFSPTLIHIIDALIHSDKPFSEETLAPFVAEDPNQEVLIQNQKGISLTRAAMNEVLRGLAEKFNGNHSNHPTNEHAEAEHLSECEILPDKSDLRIGRAPKFQNRPE